MAAFEYVAVDGAGKRSKGAVSADSARAARKELRRRGLTPLKLEPADAKPARSEEGAGARTSRPVRRRNPIATGDLVLLTRQLAMLVSSGAPVEEALGAVAQQSEKPDVRRVMQAVRASVTEGRRLADAMSAQGKSFPELYCAMVSAGESSGSLGPVLERLSDYLEQTQKVRRKVLGAVIYPSVLAVVAVVVVAALMIFVVPRVVEQFDTINQQLPTLTLVVIGVSDFLRQFGVWLALAIAVAVLVLGRLSQTPVIGKSMDRMALNVPILGKLARGVSAARFARTFSTLVASGAPVLDALAAARSTVQNRVLKDAVSQIAVSVREGGSLAGAMRKSAAFPPLMVYLAASGERGGDLASMFDKGAQYLEDEFETATTVALNLLEPLIIVVMGAMVATIVLAIMLPILQLNNLAMAT